MEGKEVTVGQIEGSDELVGLGVGSIDGSVDVDGKSDGAADADGLEEIEGDIDGSSLGDGQAFSWFVMEELLQEVLL